MVKRIVSGKVLCLLLFVVMLGCISCQRTVDIVTEPYLLDTGLVSRSICFENPSGAPGEGGRAASRLGIGRKGAPSISLKAGQEVQLCDIEGPGDDSAYLDDDTKGPGYSAESGDSCLVGQPGTSEHRMSDW